MNNINFQNDNHCASLSSGTLIDKTTDAKSNNFKQALSFFKELERQAAGPTLKHRHLNTIELSPVSLPQTPITTSQCSFQEERKSSVAVIIAKFENIIKNTADTTTETSLVKIAKPVEDSLTLAREKYRLQLKREVDLEYEQKKEAFLKLRPDLAYRFVCKPKQCRLMPTKNLLQKPGIRFTEEPGTGYSWPHSDYVAPRHLQNDYNTDLNCKKLIAQVHKQFRDDIDAYLKAEKEKELKLAKKNKACLKLGSKKKKKKGSRLPLIIFFVAILLLRKYFNN